MDRLCQKIELLTSIFALWSFLKIDGIDSLSSIVEKDWPWSNRSRLSLKKTMSESIPSIDGSDSIFFMIKSIFWSQKTIDSIEKPMIEFPTLLEGQCMGVWVSGGVDPMEADRTSPHTPFNLMYILLYSPSPGGGEVGRASFISLKHQNRNWEVEVSW